MLHTPTPLESLGLVQHLDRGSFLTSESLRNGDFSLVNARTRHQKQPTPMPMALDRYYNLPGAAQRDYRVLVPMLFLKHDQLRTPVLGLALLGIV